MTENQTGYRLNWATLGRDWPLWILMAGFLGVAFFVYPYLPDQVPSHWNIHGQVDAYSGRFFGAFFEPLLAPVLYLLLILLPLADPRKENYVRFANAYAFLRWALLIFMYGLYVITLTASLGYPVNMGLFVKAGVAVLFTIIGNFMGQFRHNYFVGIKTPWTLANEEVWQRTHRLGGRIWVLCGLGCLALSPFSGAWAAYLYFALLMIMVLVPMLYSYVIFERQKRA